MPCFRPSNSINLGLLPIGQLSLDNYTGATTLGLQTRTMYEILNSVHNDTYIIPAVYCLSLPIQSIQIVFQIEEILPTCSSCMSSCLVSLCKTLDSSAYTLSMILRT